MRLPMFQKHDDYLAFERVLADSLERPDAPDLLAWTPVSSCLIPTSGFDAQPLASRRARGPTDEPVHLNGE